MNWLLKILFFDRIYVGGLDYDDKKRFVIFFVIICTSSFISLIGCIVSVIIIEDWIDTILPASFFTFIIYSFSLFYVAAKKGFEYSFFAYNLGVVGIIISINALTKGDIFYNTLINFVFFVNFLPYLLSKKLIIKYFWTIITFIIFVIVVGWSLLFSNQPISTSKERFFKTSPYFSFLYHTFLLCFPLFVFNISIFSLFYSWNKQKKVIGSVADSIKNLYMESKILKGILELKDNNSTKIQMLFKSIISNVNDYITYLPENLKDQNYKLKRTTLCSSSSSRNHTSNQSTSNQSTSNQSSKSSNKTKYVHLSLLNSYTELGPAKRNIVIMLITLQDLHKGLSHFENSEKNRKLLDDTVNKIYEKISSFHGILSYFENNNAFAVWNSTTDCVDMFNKSFNCAIDILNMKSFRMRIFLGYDDNALCGNVGYSKFKRFTLISHQINNLRKISRECIIKQCQTICATRSFCNNLRKRELFFIADLIKCSDKNERIYIHCNEKVKEKYFINVDKDKWKEMWKKLEKNEINGACNLLTKNFNEHCLYDILKTKISNF